MRRKWIENAGVAAFGLGVMLGAGQLWGAGYPGWAYAFFVIGAGIIGVATLDLCISGLKPPISWTWAYTRRIRVGLSPLATTATQPTREGATLRENAAPIDAMMAETQDKPTLSDGLHWRAKGWYRWSNGERERWVEARCIRHELPIVEVERNGAIHQQSRTMSTNHGNKLCCPGPSRKVLSTLAALAAEPEGGMHEVTLTESSSWDAALQLAIARMG